MNSARYVEDAVKSRIVDDLASGRLHLFHRNAIQRAVDTLYEYADGYDMANEMQAFRSEGGVGVVDVIVTEHGSLPRHATLMGAAKVLREDGWELNAEAVEWAARCFQELEEVDGDDDE